MNFKYKARDRYGKSVSGVMEGENKDAVAKHLGEMGYAPIAIDEARELNPRLLQFLALWQTVTLDEVNVFTRQLLTLQTAGVPLLQGLAILEKQTRNRFFKSIIKELGANVEGGLSLSDAMAKHPKVFGELYTSMIKAGEASGHLDEILARLAELGERENETRQKISAATRYPMITLSALFLAFIVVTTFVIPRFSSIFAQFNTALPLPTRFLLGLSFIMRTYWYIVLIASCALIFLFYRYINSAKGRIRWDSFKLAVPVFGPLILMLVMSRFARTMAILMKSGLPILQVLEMASRTVGNAVIGRAINNVANSVRDGKGISEPMRISGIFPPLVVQMVAVGEDTGKIDELLTKVSEYYDQQSGYAINNLATTIEPAFVLILGAMVLVMALAIFLPMWNLITLFRH